MQQITKVCAWGVLAVWLAGCSDQVDPKLVGTWQTQLPSPQGGWVATLTIDEDGDYRITYAGSPPLPDDTGEFLAEDGTWELDKDSGSDDRGAYMLTSPDSIALHGTTGVTYWQRAGTVPAGLVPAAPMAPQFQIPTPGLQNEWPLVGLPDIEDTVANEARAWRSDAVLWGLEAQLLEGAAIGNVQTPAGQASLTFTYCSPDAEKAKVFKPGDTTGYVYQETGEEDCNAFDAVPGRLPEISDVIAKAHARGMTSSKPNRITLRRQRDLDTDQDILAWNVFPEKYVNERAQVIPFTDREQTLRTVDACAVLTRADAEKAMGRKLEPTDAGFLYGDAVWACAYKSPQSNSTMIRLQIDESPFRDKQGVLANAKRNGHQAVNIGDEAYFSLPDSGYSSLTVLLGDTLIELGVGGARDTRKATLDLGRLAVRRIVEGSAISEQKSIADRLAGTWSARAYDRMLLLTVRPDESLNLQIASNLEGAVGAADGKFEFVTRARRPIMAGAYKIRRPGIMETSGELDGQWRRVASPTLVNPALLTSTQPSADPWPTLQVDRALRANWETVGRIKGQKALMLWQIGGAAPHRLTTVVSGNGHVTRGRASIDRGILNFADALITDARKMGAPINKTQEVRQFDSDSAFTTEWKNFNGQLIWRKVN